MRWDNTLYDVRIIVCMCLCLYPRYLKLPWWTFWHTWVSGNRLSFCSTKHTLTFLLAQENNSHNNFSFSFTLKFYLRTIIIIILIIIVVEFLMWLVFLSVLVSFRLLLFLLASPAPAPVLSFPNLWCDKEAERENCHGCSGQHPDHDWGSGLWAEERRYCGRRVPTTDRSPPVEVSPRISNLISNYQVTSCRGLTGQSF